MTMTVLHTHTQIYICIKRPQTEEPAMKPLQLSRWDMMRFKLIEWWHYMPHFGTGLHSESRSVVSDSLWPHGLYSPWNSPGQNTGVGSHFLLQWIFSTQVSNPGLPHWRWILYQLSHQGSPKWRICPLWGSNSGPSDYETDALPTVLRGQMNWTELMFKSLCISNRLKIYLQSFIFPLEYIIKVIMF